MSRARLSGYLTIQARHEGQTLWCRRHRNLITLDGRRFLANLLGGHARVGVLRVAVGTGTAEPREQDTALSQQVELAEASLAPPQNVTAADGSSTVSAVVAATLPPLPAGAVQQSLREAGILIEGAGETVLYNRVLFPLLTRTSEFELYLSWEVTF